MNLSELQAPRLPPGALVITPEISFSMAKRAGGDTAKFGAYHASQDTRFRDFSSGGFGYQSRPESDYFPRFDRAKVIARLRLAFRNNPYYGALLVAYVMEIGTPTLKSQTPDATYNDQKERLFSRWAEDCEAENDYSLDQIIEIYNFERPIAGELFVLKRREGWLQLIPSELCGSIQVRRLPVDAGAKFADGTSVPAGATECDGIIRDSKKFVIGYRFGSRDENNNICFSPEQSTLVQKQYVYHLHNPDRAEGGRGIGELMPVVNSFQDLFETAEARAQQVKNASCLSLWITKNIDPNGFAEAMRGALRGGDVSNIPALKEMATSRSSYQSINKGAIYYGAPGEDLKLIEPKLNAGDFHTHYLDLLQVCSACLGGMPVEVGIEGFRASSYSSARATMNKWKRNVNRIRHRIVQKFLDPLQQWQSNRAHIFGDLPAPPPSSPDTVTHNTDENVRWGWPAIPDIDGAKTSAQNALDLANGTTTREKIYADRGEYADEEDKIFVAEKERMLKLLIKAGTSAGLDAKTAQAWALSQMPAADPRAVTALVPFLVTDPSSTPPGN